MKNRQNNRMKNNEWRFEKTIKRKKMNEGKRNQ